MFQPEYIVYIRVPIPRGEFVDPPPVIWDLTKDEALWKILSGAAQNQIDWSQVAARFDVPVDFLSQQVAYLTERHASQVRAQVRKATAAAKGSAPSPIPGSEPATSAHQRTGSALSTRRDVPISRQDVNTSSTATTLPVRPSISRHASVNTATLKDGSSSSPRHPTSFPNRALDQGTRKRLSSLPITSPTAKSSDPQEAPRRDKTISPGPAESSSNESSDNESSPAQSRIIRRPPRFQQQDVAETYQDDGDDESEPAFQSHQRPSDQTGQDMASTLKGDVRATGRQSHKGSMGDIMHQSQTSDDSSTGFPFAVQKSKSREPKGLGPLSPRRTAELAGRSPTGKGKASPREDSEGTPSMGSSFSDLDDASVTQSALEEALASHMNRPGASSRFSITQAFRSRYNPSSH